MKKNDIIIANECGLLVNLDLQFFAGNDEDEKAVLMDYEAVKKQHDAPEGQKTPYYKELNIILHLIDEADGNETDENVEEIQDALDNALLPENVKAAITKKVRVLRNRVERRLTNQLGETVRTLRDNAHLSLRELESLTGVTASYINRIESGHKTAPSIAVVKQLSQGLDFDLFSIYTSKKTKYKNLNDIILKSSYQLTDGESASIAQKEALYKIFNTIQERDFNENQTMDVMTLLEQIKAFKSISAN